MNNKREYFYDIEPVEDDNWDSAEQGKDRLYGYKKEIEGQKHLKIEPIHCRVEGVNSVGEIIESQFKNLFLRRSNYD